ncbi:MAG: hypothetical protein HQL06_10780 [Nitrospirae bacterium]|nr:hypothetical protein [Nitrospirota bacterium]
MSLDKAIEALNKLLSGTIPQMIEYQDSSGEEIIRLFDTVNRLIELFAQANGFLYALSKGNIDAEAPPRNFLISQFKQLQSNLRHLTWQTKQVAKGDLSQQVDFLGEFSASFNTMIASLREKKRAEDELKLKSLQVIELNKELEQKIADRVSELRQKEQLLIQQSKMAAMGEMIGAIAHQWRQPLNALGLLIQDLRYAYSHGELDAQYFDSSVENAMNQIKYMSETIDDFRHFFKPSKEMITFDVNKAVNELLTIVSPQIMNAEIAIEVIKDAKECLIIRGYPSEFVQVILNIVNNSRDAIVQHKKKGLLLGKGLIIITIYKEDERVNIAIKDNGGGIPEDIKDKVFEPYFTTKGDELGTGIGLYMSKVIIEKNMNGRLYVYNDDDGAVFVIEMKSE